MLAALRLSASCIPDIRNGAGMEQGSRRGIEALHGVIASLPLVISACLPPAVPEGPDPPPAGSREAVMTEPARTLLELGHPSGSPRERRLQATSPDGERLYRLGCARCHGEDGGGPDPSSIAFDVPLPDFGDCSFASREPDADWFAVVRQGGPVRAFSEIMPAFGESFTDEEIQSILDHVRTFCADDDWPRGELNLPRPLVTGKAYPEDEAVWTTAAALEGSGSVVSEFLYERRFGARNQWELKLPLGLRDTGEPEGWEAGFGDLALGVKRALFHSLESGSIVSLGGEVDLPTGDEDAGFGSGTVIAEPFVAFGQILPADGFLQLQGGFELPLDGRASEGFWRATLGRTWAEGRFGRSWTPMVEVLGTSRLERGAPVEWDLVPQLQVSLPTRQHVSLNVGARVPLTRTELREARLLVYLLWDWFDGGLLEGW